MNFIRTLISLTYEPLLILGAISSAYITFFVYQTVMRILEDHEPTAFYFLADSIFSF